VANLPQGRFQPQQQKIGGGYGGLAADSLALQRLPRYPEKGSPEDRGNRSAICANNKELIQWL
jgi:hypothetical protein